MGAQVILHPTEKKIVQLFERLWTGSGNGFYKFLQPCDHWLYRDGDSWCEELGITQKTFRRYFSPLCTHFPSKQAFKTSKDAFDGKPFASYFDCFRRVTVYFKNPHMRREEISGAFSFVPPSLTPQKAGHQNSQSDSLSIDTRDTELKSSPPSVPPKEGSGRGKGEFQCCYCAKQNKPNQSPPIHQNRKEQEALPLSSADQDVVEKMNQIWRDVAGAKVRTVKRIKSLSMAHTMVEAFKNEFNQSYGVFREYCESVISSDFLCGKNESGFQASLPWILKKETIRKIIEGVISVGKAFVRRIQENLPSKDEIQDRIHALKEDTSSQLLRLEVLKRLGVSTYLSWFEGITFQRQQDHMTIIGQNAFWRDQFKEKFESVVTSIAQSQGLTIGLQVKGLIS